MAFKLDLQKIIIGFVFALFAVQIVSVLISSVFPSISPIKGGPAILITLLTIAVISLFVLAINLNELKKSETLIFIVIIFGMLIASYIYLPKYFPNLFAISPEFSDTFRNTLGSIFSGVGG